MAWTWVQDLLTPDHRKKGYYEAHCPYKLTCPSHQPHEHAHPPKLKFIQKISFLDYQYQCRHCGLLIIIGIEQPFDGLGNLTTRNPGLFGMKPDYKFHV